MKFTRSTSGLPTSIRSAPQHDKLQRAIEADLLNAGATAQEVVQLRQCLGNQLSAALVIALMKARLDDERSVGAL